MMIVDQVFTVLIFLLRLDPGFACDFDLSEANLALTTPDAITCPGWELNGFRRDNFQPPSDPESMWTHGKNACTNFDV